MIINQSTKIKNKKDCMDSTKIH